MNAKMVRFLKKTFIYVFLIGITIVALNYRSLPTNIPEIYRTQVEKNILNDTENLISSFKVNPEIRNSEELFALLSDRSNYYVDINNTTQCDFPRLEPWNDETKKLLREIPIYDKCLKHKPLTYVKNNQLFFNETVAEVYYKGNISYCKFAPVLRSAIQREQYILGEFKEFPNGLELIDDVVKVICYSQNSNNVSKIEYEYVHSLIFRKEKLKEKGEASERLNVLIMLFDSVSASSFKRALPKTFEYLKSLTNFHSFEKFHTIGENTLPNIVPMFSGLRSESLLGNKKIPPPFDDFPFIWKNFSQRNYVTYFNEEWRDSMFNFAKFGFRKKPMDYWQRHYWLAVYESKSAAPNNLNSNSHPCYYDVLYHKLGFKWLADLLKEYEPTNNNKESSTKIDQNLFGFFKSNEMSHDYLERLFWIDDDLKALLQEIFTESFLNSTLFILMGDHGHRFHAIRPTFSGKLEQKLPFLSMLLPRKLTQQNPFLNDVLKQNTQRLTTTYDIYETLRQLLIDQIDIHPEKSNYLRDKLDRQTNQVANNHTGYSLFMPLPQRTCQQANIPDYLCSCDMVPKNNVIDGDTKVATLASEFLVDYINNQLLKSYSNICVQYKLKAMKSFQVVDKKLNKYSIIFETSPNNAVFDALVDVSNDNERFEVIGKVTRISLYGKTADCMLKYELKNYCYCKSNLKS